MMTDLELSAQVRVWTDLNAAMAIASRISRFSNIFHDFSMIYRISRIFKDFFQPEPSFFVTLHLQPTTSATCWTRFFHGSRKRVTVTVLLWLKSNSL